jgi:hypothetical protein
MGLQQRTRVKQKGTKEKKKRLKRGESKSTWVNVPFKTRSFKLAQNRQTLIRTSFFFFFFAKLSQMAKKFT